MRNWLITGFPSVYRGYKLNTDFRVGIKISLILEDEHFDMDLRLRTCFELLYNGRIPKTPEVAYKGLLWFLSCGKSEMVATDPDTPLDLEDVVRNNNVSFDFTFDQLDIWGGFWMRGVDIETERMHWFKFMTALQNLKEPVISNKMEYRTMDLTKMKGDIRREYALLQNRLRVRSVVCDEEADEELVRRAEEERVNREFKEKHMTEYERKYLEAINKSKTTR